MGYDDAPVYSVYVQYVGQEDNLLRADTQRCGPIQPAPDDDELSRIADLTTCAGHPASNQPRALSIQHPASSSWRACHHHPFVFDSRVALLSSIACATKHLSSPCRMAQICFSMAVAKAHSISIGTKHGSTPISPTKQCRRFLRAGLLLLR